MLKLNASFSKKVPADEEFSSKSFHASIEAELPDGLTENQLKDKIHNTFELVRTAVEAEIGVSRPNASGTADKPRGRRNAEGGKPAEPPKASPKQLNYLLDLAHDKGVKPREIMERAGVDDLSDLNKTQCSKLIDELTGKAKAA